VFYEDGSTFSSVDGDPSEAPGWSVQAIAHADDLTGRSVSQRDYYWWDDEYEQWAGGDLLSLCQWFVAKGLLKVGSYASNDRYHEILRQANRDDLLPERSAWREHERR